MGWSDVGDDADIRLQEHVAGSGFTDVEIRTTTMHVIIEAKRGWEMPERPLAKSRRRCTPGLDSALLILAEGSPSFAAGKYPTAVPGAAWGAVPLLYRSWEQPMGMTDGVSGGASTQAGFCASSAATSEDS